MPLIIEGHPVTSCPSSVTEFIQTYPQYQIESRRFRSIPSIAVDPQEPYLYVHQMESACVSVDDPNIHMLGTDGATTCCCVVVRHTGSFATSVGHFDGNDTKDGLARMVEGVVELTKEWTRKNNIIKPESHTQHQYEVYLIGGFDDARNISLDVSLQLLENLCETNLDLHLKAACICANNTFYQDNIPYPSITGIICNVKTGRIMPASFTFQGPLEEIRRLRFATLPPIVMHSVYIDKTLTIKPYEWTLENDTIQQLLGLNTNSFLHYWSTSPLAEKPNYVSTCKMALSFLKNNRDSLFCSGTKAYKFIRTNNQWKLVE